MGDHPSCTNAVRKDGETADSARSVCEGLGLDGEGAQPPQKKKVSPPRTAPVQSMYVRRMAKTATDGFDPRQPGPRELP